MGINYVPVAGFNKDVVARQLPEVRSPFCSESSGVLDQYGEVSGDVDGIPLRPSIFGLDDNPIRGREDGPTPTIAILQPDAEEEVMDRAGAIKTHTTGLRIDADEIISVSLAQQVGSVARDFCARGVRNDPFAPERKVYDNWSKHRGILALEMPKDY
jgi:hypothetical protein